MPKKSSGDRRHEENYIITALGQMEFMKLKLHESQQLAERFTKEFEKLTRGLFASTLEDDDMVEFRVEVPRETWEAWQEGIKTSDFEKAAFDALSWGMFNLITKHKDKE